MHFCWLTSDPTTRKKMVAALLDAGADDSIVGRSALWGGGPVTPRELLEAKLDSKPHVMRRVVSRGEMNRLGSQIAFDDISYGNIKFPQPQLQ